MHQEVYGSLKELKFLIIPDNNVDLIVDNSQSFKNKAALVEETKDAVDGNSFVKNTKIVVLLKYLSNFWGSQKMPLINCKLN